MRLSQVWSAFALIALLCELNSLFNQVDAAPCVSQTPLYGPTDSTNYTEVVEDQDDSTRIAGMYYCIKYQYSCSTAQHFRGFRVTLEADTGTFYQTYGTLDQPSDVGCPDDICTYLSIDEEIKYVEIYSDTNDVEGIVFTGHLGTVYTMRANGADSSPVFQMAGRPIGFGMYMGYGGTDNQPLQLSIMYNECNCPASEFTGESQPADMVTTVVSGPADVQNLAYQKNYMEDIYNQDCGTYTVTLSPVYSFLTLATTGATGPAPNYIPYTDQLTLSSNNVIDIGQYDILMTISQESANGDGYSTPYTGQMPSFSYNFLATINPCVTSLSFATNPTDITYTIGSTEVTGAAYSFVQADSCNYGEFTELTDDPFFVVHNDGAQDFTVPYTENRALDGTYTVTLTGYILEPDDYTMATYTRKEVTDTFDITMIDPCATTTIDAFAIADMSIDVHGSSDVQILSVPTDTVAALYGDTSGRTYCGTKTLQVTSVSPASPTYTEFLTFDTTSTPTFTALSIDPDHQGTYTVTVTITMDEFSSISTTTTFDVVVNSCQVSSMTKTAVPDQSYIVYTPMIDFSWVDFGISPCAYALDYTYSLYDTIGLGTQVIPGPSMITQSNGDRTFNVYSIAPADVGTYQVIVTGTTPAGKMNVPYSEDLIVNLVVTNDCPTDVVTPTSTIPDMIYLIGNDGTISFTPTWTITITGCPITYEISRVVSSVEQALTGTETAVLTFDSSDGSLDILTTDTTLDGETWTIKLWKESTYGTAPDMYGIYEFDLTFRDPCWDSTLTASVVQSSFTWDLWQAESMAGTAMTNTEYGTGCGGFYYELEYLSGPLIAAGIDPMTVYTLTETAGSGSDILLEGTPSVWDWIGEHTYRIKCSNGNPSNAPAGDGTGLYNSVYSNDFVVTILDPCVYSVVNFDGVVSIADIDASGSLTEYETAVQNGPKDSKADQYGNGYDLCDYLGYQLLDSNKDTYAATGIIDVQPTRAQFAMDTFNLKVYNTPDGYLFTDDVLLKISLNNYPQSTAAYVPFTLSYRMCRPWDFSIEPVEDRLYYLRQNSHMVIYEVNQAPCDYQLGNYQVKQVIDGLEAEPPEFISLGTPESPKLWYETSDTEDVGKYTLRLYGSLMRRGEVVDSIYTDFLLQISPEVQIASPTDSNIPQWDIGLQDQTIDIEDSLLIPVDIIQNPWGQKMTVTVDLGSAKDFLEWDSELETFSIHEGVASEMYVGDHVVCMNVAHFNETYREEYNDCFTITIKPGAAPANPGFKWTPPELEGQVPVNNFTIGEYGLEMGPYNPQQPIPYIADLSITGVLTIGWDRTMTEREDFQEINPDRVAVKDQSEVIKAENAISTSDASQVTLLQDDEGFRRRRLIYRHEGYYLNETTSEQDWLLVLEALELRMNPGEHSDENKLNLTWEMIGFSDHWIHIQCYFEYPRRVSEYIDYDTLEVFFWGVDWFRSSEGEPVRYGTRLDRPILRQIDPKYAQTLGVIGHILQTVVALVMLIAVVLSGRLLPTWMFFNTLQLLSHLPLFKSQVSAEAAFFLSQFLDLTRFNMLWPLYRDWNFKQGNQGEGALNLTFDTYGYSSMYMVGNIPVVLILGISVAVLWLLAVLKLLCVKGCERAVNGGVRDIFLLNEHGLWVTNFAVRFIYEVFLVVLMSSLISLNKGSQENLVPGANDPHDPQAAKSLQDLKHARLLLALALLFLIFVAFRVLASRLTPQSLITLKQKLTNCIDAVRSRPKSCCKRRSKGKSSQPLSVKKSEKASLEDSQQIHLKSVFESTIKDRGELSEIQSLEPAKPESVEVPALVESVPEDKNSVFTISSYYGSENESQASEQQPDQKSDGFQAPFDVSQEEKKERTGAEVDYSDFIAAQLRQNYQGPRGQQQFEGGESLSELAIKAKYRTKLTETKTTEYEVDQQDVLNQEAMYKAEAQENINDERLRQHTFRENHPMTKTLAYGLTVGKKGNVASVHAFLFLLRRLVLALSLVFAYDNVGLGISLLLASCTAMISLLSLWDLWDDQWIGLQHFVNELVLAFVCLVLLVLSNAYDLPYAATDALGTTIIATLIAFIIFNCAVLVYDVWHWIQLHMRRARAIVEHRRTRYTIQQVNKVTEQAQAHLYQLAIQGAFQEKRKTTLDLIRQKTLSKSLTKKSKSHKAERGAKYHTSVERFEAVQSKILLKDSQLVDGQAQESAKPDSLAADLQIVKKAALDSETPIGLIAAKAKPFSKASGNYRVVKTVTMEVVEPPKPAQPPISNRSTKEEDAFDRKLDQIENQLKGKDRNNLDELAFQRRDSRSSHFYLHNNLKRPWDFAQTKPDPAKSQFHTRRPSEQLKDEPSLQASMLVKNKFDENDVAEDFKIKFNHIGGNFMGQRLSPAAEQNLEVEKTRNLMRETARTTKIPVTRNQEEIASRNQVDAMKRTQDERFLQGSALLVPKAVPRPEARHQNMIEGAFSSFHSSAFCKDSQAGSLVFQGDAREETKAPTVQYIKPLWKKGA